MNKDNLRTLAEYLLRPKLEARFDMASYAETFNRRTTCGTVGCAVGHGPYAGIKKLLNENWLEYTERVFVIPSGLTEATWCFSSAWALFDNTPEGAAHRILYLVKHGKPPTNFLSHWERYRTGWWRKGAS